MPCPRPSAAATAAAAALALVVAAASAAAAGGTSASSSPAATAPAPPVLLRAGVARPTGPTRRALLAAAAPLTGLPPPPTASGDDPRWGPLAGGELFIVALHAGADPDAARAAIVAAGGTPSSPLPENAILAILPTGFGGGASTTAAAALTTDPAVAWLAPFAPPYKTAPEWGAVLEWAASLAKPEDDEDGGGVADGSEARAAASAAAAAAAAPTATPPPPGKAAAPYLRPPSSPPAASNTSTTAATASLPAPAWTVEVLVTFPPLGPFPGGSSSGPATTAPPRYAPAAAAAAAWAPALASICGTPSACTLTPSDASLSASRLAITAPAAVAPALIPWLAAASPAHWISPRARARPRNFFAAGICQAGAPGRVDVATGAVWEANGGAATTTPHWSAGLRGGGQTLGMGDTGLDADHCLFRDPAVPGPGAPGSAAARVGVDGVRAWESATHRKLRFYRMLADGVDANGHGTHCAGSAVGAPLDAAPATARPWAGLAPGARLAFTDLGAGAAGDLAVPLDLGADYFQHHYDRGARVHSDSWGTDATAYDDMAWDFDAFAAAHPDFLPVIAAGNDGADGGDGAVTSPAVAKNGLAVGATLTAPFSGSPEFESVAERRVGEAVRVVVTGTGPRPGGGPHRALAAAFGPALPLDGPSVARRLVAASPIDACAPLTGPAATWSGAVVLATRGNCSFASKAAAAGAAGAAALLVSNNGPGGLVRAAAPASGGPAGPLAPTAALALASGRDLVAALGAGLKLNASLSREALPTDRFESLAYYSSTGPTPDGRTKPDFVAPGTTVSAFSDGDPGSGNCGLGVDRGTSMATPVGAGAAVLARQYFMEGWHVSGAPNASSGIAKPSGALLRAVLVGGTAPMRGVRPSNGGAVDGAPLEVGPSEAGPSAAVGHGRLHLDRALPLAPLNASSWGLVFTDGALLRTQGAAARFCVRAAPGRRPLSVTLAWTDPPPSPAAATPLVNDLDLTVTSEALGGYPRRGNGGATADRVNTVERVWLDDAGGGAGGEVVISVAASRLPAPPQAFALAVHGGLASALRAGAACASLPIPSITAAPRALTNATSARLAWTSASPPPNGWECRLSGAGGATAPAPLRPFSPCTPPLEVAGGLRDGRVEFGVRAVGYSLSDVAAWTVDATPPVANITSKNLPSPSSPRTATFAFGLAAGSAPEPGGASFQCRLARTAPPAARPAEPVPLVTGGGGPVGAWTPCTSPVRYQALGPGSWAFGVRAVDGAGNRQVAAPVTAAWSVALPRVAALASVVGGSGGSSDGSSNANNTAASAGRGSATFAFNAAGGDGDGDGTAAGNSTTPPAASFLCQLAVWEAAAAAFTPSAPPAPCTSPASFTGLAKGLYRFTVALVEEGAGSGGGDDNATAAAAGGGGWPAGALALAAVADVSIEGDAVVPILTTSPPPFLAAHALPAVFEWGLDGGGGGGGALPTGASYACLLQGPPAARLPGDFTSPCAPPLSFQTLPDGSYTFRVAVQGADGTRGPSAGAAFGVDGAGPAVEGVAWSAAGRALSTLPGTLCSVAAPGPAALAARPTGSDGVLGSGVATLYCRVVVDEGTGPSAAGGRAGGGGGGGAATAGVSPLSSSSPAPAMLLTTDGASPLWEPCTAGFNVTLSSPGDHALEVKAVDAAGNEGAAVRCGVSVTGEGSGVGGRGRGGRTAALVAGSLAGAGLLAASLGLVWAG